MLMLGLMVAAMFALTVVLSPLCNHRSFRNNFVAMSLAAICVVLVAVSGGWVASAQELSTLQWIVTLVTVPTTSPRLQ